MDLIGRALKRLGYAILGKDKMDKERKSWEAAKQIDVVHQPNKKRR